MLISFSTLVATESQTQAAAHPVCVMVFMCAFACLSVACCDDEAVCECRVVKCPQNQTIIGDHPTPFVEGDLAGMCPRSPGLLHAWSYRGICSTIWFVQALIWAGKLTATQIATDQRLRRSFVCTHDAPQYQGLSSMPTFSRRVCCMHLFYIFRRLWHLPIRPTLQTVACCTAVRQAVVSV